eukprot:TRINITY_DN29570_c0_g1_i1.p1 TRINITY_DN29570_c0_g1~~TRINITY_DN29570_c0_g1_i1.p1  ORF type:complete len:191 (+),score=25.07 TRINITY_DN29570_c0_g1_i1:49-621(+)
MIRHHPSTPLSSSSAASDVYKRQVMSAAWHLAENIAEGTLEQVSRQLDSTPELLNRPIRECAEATPLGYACRLGKVLIVRELLRRDADLLIQDSTGACALHRACERGHVDCALTVVEALEQRKWLRPAMRSSCKGGWCPVLLAARAGVLAELLPAFKAGDPRLDAPHPRNGLMALTVSYTHLPLPTKRLV